MVEFRHASYLFFATAAKDEGKVTTGKGAARLFVWHARLDNDT